MNDELRYKILKLLEKNPALSQRALAGELGISVGKANYCLQALIEKGHVKMRNFRNNPDKRAYGYLLTPAGIEEKAKVTARFLRRKMEEYETILAEIEELRAEVASAMEQP